MVALRSTWRVDAAASGAQGQAKSMTGSMKADAQREGLGGTIRGSKGPRYGESMRGLIRGRTADQPVSH